MYVCICNGLTDRDFAHVGQAGAQEVREAFLALGEEPQCGHCFDCVSEVLADARLEIAQDKARVVTE